MSFLNSLPVGNSAGTMHRSNVKTQAMAPGTKQLRRVKKNIPKPAPSRKPGRSSGKGSSGEGLWIPNAERPPWLNGTLPGDRGFDPLGLAKPAEYLQVDLDELDQNKGVNKAGTIIGKFATNIDNVSTDSLSPYSEVFGLQRFRETELIHGRWAMLATLGVVVAEATTGVAWQDAGKVELDGASYAGLSLPFTVTQLSYIEALLVGGAEIIRNREQDLEARIYPGGAFDPLGLADDPQRAFDLKTAELKHGRLAMVSFLGFGVQALVQGKGALGSLGAFALSFEGVEEAIQSGEGAIEAVENAL